MRITLNARSWGSLKDAGAFLRTFCTDHVAKYGEYARVKVDDRDLEEWLVASVARSKTEAEVDAAFDQLAQQLLAARGRYEKTRALDEALFGKDFEA